MLRAIKQSVFTGIGLANFTNEKIANFVTEVKQQANLSEQQAEEFQKEVTQRSDEARKELSALIDQQIDHSMIQMGLIKGEARKAADTAEDAFRNLVDQRVNEALQRIGAARTEDVESITRRLELLEQKIKN